MLKFGYEFLDSFIWLFWAAWWDYVYKDKDGMEFIESLKWVAIISLFFACLRCFLDWV